MWKCIVLVVALLAALAVAAEDGKEVVTMFEVDAETGAFCVLSDYVPVVNAAYKAVLVFQFYDPVDVLKIQFPAPADAEMAPAKTFTAADLEDLSEVVVVLHEFDGTNQNGWNNELFEEFQFLNGIVHSEPAIAQAALHIMTYDDIVPPANHNCPIPNGIDEVFSLEPASYFEDVSVVQESSSSWSMDSVCMLRLGVGLLAVVLLLLAGVSIGYCGCTYLVSQAEEKGDNSSEPDDELVFECSVPMNQPMVRPGAQPQYMPFRPTELGSPAITYNVAVLV
mmetsp:Transcript_760/g.1083  ORF Transcript_760/g.1083 Transcript_760/m.1083 type:complete len:280 (-) Transcript_760:74-913(-)